MADPLGRGSYELDVDSSRGAAGIRSFEGDIAESGKRAERAFDRVEKEITQTGQTAERALGGTAVRNADKLTRAIDRTTASSGRFHGSLKSFGTGVAGGVGFAAFLGVAGAADMATRAIVDGISDSIEAASNLNETISKGEQIFKANAKGVEAWADTASTSFGQSKRAAIDAASGFAGLFQTVDIELNQATDMSKKLTQLGSDLASFYNTSVEDALAALKSGLNGESEPLRRFNVFLSDNAVKAKAAELGLRAVNGQLTEGQKAQARYAIIMGQTTSAQGDFARTSDGLANTQRTLSAQVEDLQAKIGEELLPVMLELAQFVRDDVVPVLTTMAENADDIGLALDALVNGPMLAFKHRLEDQVEDHEALERERADAVKAAMDRTKSAYLLALEKMEGGTDTHLNAMSGGFEDFSDDASDAFTDVRREIDKTVTKFKVSVDTLTSTAQAAADAIWGPLILADEIAANKREINDARRVLSDKEATAEEKKNAAARIRVLQSEREVLLAQGQALGILSEKQEDAYQDHNLKAWSKAVRQRNFEAAAAIRAHIEELARLYRAQERTYTFHDTGFGNVAGHAQFQHDAKGGPVTAGIPAYVGEEGMELFIPGLDGMIATHAQVVAALRDMYAKAPAASAGPWSGAYGSPASQTMSGTATLRVQHELAPGAAQALRQAGYDERGVAQALVDASSMYSGIRQLTAMTAG